MRTVAEGQECFETWNFQHPKCDRQLQNKQIHGLSFQLHLQPEDHKG